MKKIIKFTILFLIISLILIMICNWYSEEKIKDDTEITMQVSSNQNSKVVQTAGEVRNEWKEHQDGYNIIAKLEIPKINLKTNVLEEYSDNSLLISVCKFWGCEPNDLGNFCIAGHNYYKRKNMFYHIKELDNGDKIFLTDNACRTIEYEVYNVSKVSPYDVECLSQETNGKREITLITCTSDSKKRIIVKAREIDYEKN